MSSVEVSQVCGYRSPRSGPIQSSQSGTESIAFAGVEEGEVSMHHACVKRQIYGPRRINAGLTRDQAAATLSREAKLSGANRDI